MTYIQPVALRRCPFLHVYQTKRPVHHRSPWEDLQCSHNVEQQVPGEWGHPSRPVPPPSVLHRRRVARARGARPSVCSPSVVFFPAAAVSPHVPGRPTGCRAAAGARSPGHRDRYWPRPTAEQSTPPACRLLSRPSSVAAWLKRRSSPEEQPSPYVPLPCWQRHLLRCRNPVSRF